MSEREPSDFYTRKKPTMNLTRIDLNNNDSLFDSIRRYDENGNEFWLARELMPLLEYKQWRRFNDAIERAKITCQNSGNVVDSHFADVDQMQQIGDSQAQRLVTIDVKLTRYSCYLIAMNGDPRKDAIAQAQTYFAVKTREAEVIIPQQNEQLLLAQIELEKMKLENENLKLKTNFMERRNAIQELHGVQMLALLDGNVKVIEKIEKVTETVICKNDQNVSFIGKSTAELGKELGFKTGKEFEHWLIRNKQEHLICQGMRAVQASYVPLENIPTVKTLFTQLRQRTYRQTVIGE